MKFTIIFLVHIFTFVSLSSAMDVSPEDILKAHHIAVKKALESKLSQYPQDVKDTCHHLVDKLVPLEMSKMTCYSLIDVILRDPLVSKGIRIRERPRDNYAMITFISENRAELFSPMTPVRQYIDSIFFFLKAEP